MCFRYGLSNKEGTLGGMKDKRELRYWSMLILDVTEWPGTIIFLIVGCFVLYRYDLLDKWWLLIPAVALWHWGGCSLGSNLMNAANKKPDDWYCTRCDRSVPSEETQARHRPCGELVTDRAAIMWEKSLDWKIRIRESTDCDNTGYNGGLAGFCILTFGGLDHSDRYWNRRAGWQDKIDPVDGTWPSFAEAVDALPSALHALEGGTFQYGGDWYCPKCRGFVSNRDVEVRHSRICNERVIAPKGMVRRVVLAWEQVNRRMISVVKSDSDAHKGFLILSHNQWWNSRTGWEDKIDPVDGVWPTFTETIYALEKLLASIEP